MKPQTKLYDLVSEELHSDPRLRGAQLGIACDDGIITLTGTVSTLSVKFAAARAANRVHAVRAVVNEINVDPGVAKARDDLGIAKAVLIALRSDFEVPYEDVKVRVEQGWVFLEGEVSWNYERIAAQSAVQHLFGVRGVSNNLSIKSTPHNPSQIKFEIEKAIQRMADADAKDIAVVVEHGKVYLRGTVHLQATRDHASIAAWNTKGVTSVVNDIHVSDSSRRASSA